MNRLYSTVFALSFVVACDKLEDRVKNSGQSIGVETDTPYQSAASPRDRDSNLCDGPPTIQHLFTAYDGIKRIVDKSGNVDYPVVKRVYTIAEAEMQRARDALELCKKNESAPVVARPFYIMANQYAISALAWISEVGTRVKEPIFFKTNAEEW